jgi:hypothetical protein
LFISDNKGLLWEHISLRADGPGGLPDPIKINNTFGLSVSPDDSVYLSYAGIASNFLVRLNTVKSIEDIRNNNFWKPYLVSNPVSWWLDRILNNIHFAKNGDWYSSANGSINTGGTFFSKNKGLSWNKIDYGLGLDIYGERNAQIFAETSKGKIFMVQLLDERIYMADTTVVTANRNDPASSFNLYLYPNPVFRTGKLVLSTSFPSTEYKLSVIDFNGRTLSTRKFYGNKMEFEAPGQSGYYIVQVENKFSLFRKPLIVL